MDKQSILHKTKSSYAYAFNKNNIHLRIRSKRDDLTNVYVLMSSEEGWKENSKGQWIWGKSKVQMVKEFSTELYDYWFLEVTPPELKMRYGFLLQKDEKEELFIERGFFSVDDDYIQNDINSYFSFPYLHTKDVFNPPSWVKDTVWYQIFPDRFNNGDLSNDVLGTNSWENTTAPAVGEYEFYGGDLEGIIEKIPYLEELGITGIYLTPIFKAPSSHKYDTEDYYEIDSSFGDKETLRRLVDLAHEKGIRIMLDAVFNHIGKNSYQFQDAWQKREKSIYYDWFFFDGDHYLNFSPNMPKLNTNNPEVIAYLIDIATYWIKETNIDGWRLDVANEVDHEFWRQFRRATKAIKPDTYICGEIWHDSQAWLNGDQFDGVMNYPLAKPIQEWIAAGRIDGIDFVEQFVHAYTRYSKNVNDGMMTLLDSHDTQRIINCADYDQQKVDMCFALLSTVPGSICFYYGSEIYLQGEEDPDNRRPMIWGEVASESNLKQLISLRNEYSAMGSSGDYAFLYYDNSTVMFKKYSQTETIYFLFNTQESQQVELPHEMKNKSYLNLMDQTRIELSETIMLENYSYYILLEKK